MVLYAPFIWTAVLWDLVSSVVPTRHPHRQLPSSSSQSHPRHQSLPESSLYFNTQPSYKDHTPYLPSSHEPPLQISSRNTYEDRSLYHQPPQEFLSHNEAQYQHQHQSPRISLKLKRVARKSPSPNRRPSVVAGSHAGMNNFMFSALDASTGSINSMEHKSNRPLSKVFVSPRLRVNTQDHEPGAKASPREEEHSTVKYRLQSFTSEENRPKIRLTSIEKDEIKSLKEKLRLYRFPELDRKMEKIASATPEEPRKSTSLTLQNPSLFYRFSTQRRKEDLNVPLPSLNELTSLVQYISRRLYERNHEQKRANESSEPELQNLWNETKMKAQPEEVYNMTSVPVGTSSVPIRSRIPGSPQSPPNRWRSLTDW